MRSLFFLFSPVVSLALGLSAPAAETPEASIEIKIHGEAKNPVDHRLFGQFLERASFGEPGPETVVQKDGTLPADVVAMLKSMAIPVIRFPGGTDVEYIDWRDMIDNVPGREGEPRPITKGRGKETITNRFGYDEYFHLRDQLGCETILVLNTLDAAGKRKPLDEAIRDAAGLVAYANSPGGAKLPEGMPDWPAIRAANGHSEPFRAEYIQIGNETWMGTYGADQKKGAPDASDEELAQWYHKCIREFIRVVREIDPEVKIIIDGESNFAARKLVFGDPYILKNVTFAAFHQYSMGDMGKFKQAEGPLTHMTDEDWWAYWTSIPGAYSEQGMAVGSTNVKHPDTLGGGLPLACTEWNWNRWAYKSIKPKPAINWQVASALGTAGFVHAMIRNGQYIRLATQSMLLGAKWEIAAVQVDPEGKHTPYFSPQGQVTTFYGKNHGSERLETTVDSVPRLTYAKNSDGAKANGGALFDAIATRSADTLFVHFINRSLKAPVEVRLDLADIPVREGKAELKVLAGDPFEPADQDRTMLEERSESVPVATPAMPVTLPPHSLSILRIPLAKSAD